MWICKDCGDLVFTETRLDKEKGFNNEDAGVTHTCYDCSSYTIGDIEEIAEWVE